MGCKTNVSAKILHNKYAELLNEYTLPAPMKEIAKKIVSEKLDSDNQEVYETLTLLKKNKTEIENKIKNNKIRFANGDIDEDVYTLALQTNQEKLDKILLEIETVKKNLSNFSINVDEVIEMCCKLGVLWQESSLDICQKLQNIIFPEGIFWNKENSTYRTEKTNKAIELMARISTIYKQKNEGDIPSLVNLCG